MTMILNTKYPQIATRHNNVALNRERGFKFNRIHGVWTSSAINVARSELTPFEFSEYLLKIEKWNKIEHHKKIDDNFRHLLRDYQKIGVKRLMDSRSLLLGDEMGLGKTIQTAVAISSLGESAIVVCPNHLVQNWMDELSKWTTNITIVDRSKIPSGARWGKIRNGVVYIVPYSQVHNIETAECGILVCDESHYLNTPTSRRTKAIHEIKSQRRWFLSGTAYKNHPTELWSQFILLRINEFYGGTKSGFELGFGLSELIQGDKPKSGGSPFARSKTRRKSIPTHLKPKSVLSDDVRVFLKLAMSPFYLRRDKTQHLDLPPKVRQIHRFGSALHHEKSIVDKFAHLELDEIMKPSHISEIAEMRIESALKLVKSKSFKDYTEEIIKKPTIVFAYHNDVLDALVEHFNNYDVSVWTITRNDDAKTISNSTKQFQVCDEGVMIISIKKGATGLTLTNAQRICFVELDWTMAELDQCESRVHRYGKNGNVLIDYFVTAGGIDDLVLNKLKMKELNNDIIQE